MNPVEPPTSLLAVRQTAITVAEALSNRQIAATIRHYYLAAAENHSAIQQNTYPTSVEGVPPTMQFRVRGKWC
jgi:hypothetical protein